METDLLGTAKLANLAKRQRQANTVINVGLVANLMLAVAKVFAGIYGHSKALLADGINSVSDVVYLLFTKALVKLSSKPADKEHPYGHHQLESVAAVVIGAFVITTGLTIFWDAINTAYDLFINTSTIQPVQSFTWFVALGTIIIKLALMFQALYISKKTNNLAISALARDHRNDIFSSAAAGIGIMFSLYGFIWVDPLASTLVAIIIVKTGIDILRESTNELMDTLPDTGLEQTIQQLIISVPGVKKVEAIHLHRFGPFYMANIVLGVAGQLTVTQGDGIADAVEQQLYHHIELMKKVYIHYHPIKMNA
ncbi:MAG: cation diffusion facilitator family transporter [Patescibacteria group bacterium]|jgi:cation diffusion facilitator family transporter